MYSIRVTPKKSQRVRPLALCAYALLFVFLPVKPLADVVCDYTCSDGNNKRKDILHAKFTSFLGRKECKATFRLYHALTIIVTKKADSQLNRLLF
jgi:hypothetical protein